MDCAAFWRWLRRQCVTDATANYEWLLGRMRESWSADITEFGRELSIIGLGGVVFCSLDQAESNAIVAEAIDRGVNYFDVAPSYGSNQETEIKLGGAMSGKRDGVFLACKTGERTKTAHVWNWNARCATSKPITFDLYQLHAITGVRKWKQHWESACDGNDSASPGRRQNPAYRI